MTPVPKKKHTRSRSNIRRNSASARRILPNLVVCPNCKKFKETHTACRYCGFYKTVAN